MAAHKVNGGTILLMIDPSGGTSYKHVICLTSLSKSDTVNAIDASSGCGPDKSPGVLDMSYTFEGHLLQDPATTQISGTTLRQLLRGKSTIGWKITPESPQIGDEIESGTGFLTELSSTYAFDNIGTFSGTFVAYGTPTLTIED